MPGLSILWVLEGHFFHSMFCEGNGLLLLGTLGCPMWDFLKCRGFLFPGIWATGLGSTP